MILSAIGRSCSRYLGVDAGVYCLSYASWTLRQLGYPDQALKRGNEAVALARGLSLPLSLAFAECFVVILRQYRREAQATQETAEASLHFVPSMGFPTGERWRPARAAGRWPNRGATKRGLHRYRKV